MPADPRCESIQLEISTAYDELRPLPEEIASHRAACDDCAAFLSALGELDNLLAVGRFAGAPDVASAVVDRLSVRSRPWWAVAAVAAVGLVVGGVVGMLGSRVDIGLAKELQELLYVSGSAIEGMSADLVVVERGVHPDVAERVYSGTIDYVAPESLAIDLVDTTEYPSAAWIHNDLRLIVDDGDATWTAVQPCPVPALPGCLVAPRTDAITHQPPFVEGTVRPLEIVGPGRSFSLSGDIEILGSPGLAGRQTIQVASTVAGAPLLRAITDRGAWRELHPTDPVIMWLDSLTMVPLRIEVFAADSPERELWQIRRGYTDQLGGSEPIFIVDVSDVDVRPGVVGHYLLDDPVAGGFVEGPVDISGLDLPDGFKPHRSGQRLLANGGSVDVASWSDGRTWVKVEATSAWDELHLFGISSPFVEKVELANGGVGYLASTGAALAVHGEQVDLAVSGSVPRSVLIDIADSLDPTGMLVPLDWAESSIVSPGQLDPGVLVPEAEGWSILARADGDSVVILLAGGGDRSVLIAQGVVGEIELPVGPDVQAVEVRGNRGRYDAATGALEWVEEGRRIEIRSESVSFDEIVEIAETMSTR